MDQQQFAAEFAQVKAGRTRFLISMPAYDRRGSLVRTRTITLDEYDEAYATFARFLRDRREEIAAALTEWAQQDDVRLHALQDAEQACVTNFPDGTRFICGCAERIARLKEEPRWTNKNSTR